MKMEAQVVNSGFVVLKDTVWKLSSRVMLLEGFIKKQFGNVFWNFCESQVDALNTTSVSVESLMNHVKPPASKSSPPQVPVSEKNLNMPPMIRIFGTGSGTGNSSSSQNQSHNQIQQHLTSTSTNNNAAVSVNKNNKPIPPPPPLSCIKNNVQANIQVKIEPNNTSNNSISSSTYQHKPRNFLPKSLALKPKLFSVNTVNSGSSSGLSGGGNNANSNNASGSSGSGNNGSILKELKEPVVCVPDEVGPSNNSSDSSADSFRYIKTEPSIQQFQNIQNKKSPAIISLNSLSNVSKQNVRLSSVSVQPISNISKPSAAIPLRTSFMTGNNYADLEYYKGDSESDEDLDGYSADGYLAAEFVAATLAGPAGADNAKKMRYSYASSSSSLNGSTPRQMRPNPCHTRCQNRCHDIWTDGDRMGVFETYWSIPTEEERREFVAQRIERVDMVTKRTEFSNFRTCTFKYYLPHPDNPWVQVCKNFFLATIDEKRSYIEKIAQSVKGETEKISAKDIPFRRRNQMQRVAGSVDYVGWMTGMGLSVDGNVEGEPGDMMENMDGDGIDHDVDPDAVDEDQDQDQDVDADGDEGDGLEMMEEAND